MKRGIGQPYALRGQGVGQFSQVWPVARQRRGQFDGQGVAGGLF